MGALILAFGILEGHGSWIPEMDEFDKAIAEEPNPERVVVVGSDASLAAVVRWMLHTNRLHLPIGFAPVDRRASVVARVWRLPRNASEFARDGEPVRIPLVRDDSGGVLMGLGRIGPVQGEAYCDDQLALRGRAASIEVTPDPVGVRGRVVHSRLLRRAKTYTGRAFQVGCEPASVVHDGVAHPRPVERWTWYRHTEDLRAVALPT